MVRWSGRRSIYAFLVEVEIVGPLLAPAPHSDIATNPNPTTLLCDNPTQGGAGSQSRELLGAVDSEGNGFHFETEVEGRLRHGCFVERLCVGVLHGSVLVGILGVLDLLVQVEAQPVTTLMAHRQIRENEVSGLRWAIEISNTCHGHTSQHGACRRTGHASMGDGTSSLQRREQEEIGIVGEGDVGLGQVIVGVGFVDTQFHHRGRVNRSTVGRC